jgi:hypothetical protein
MTPEEIAKKYGGVLSSTTVEEDTYPDELARGIKKEAAKKPVDPDEIAKKYGGSAVSEAVAVDADEIAKKYGGSVSAASQAEDMAAELLANTENQEAALLEQGMLPTWVKRQEMQAAEDEAYGTPGIGEVEMGAFAPALGAPIPSSVDPTREKIKLPETAWKEVTQNKTNKKIIEDYAVARFGESGKQGKDESDEEYASRWATAMRSSMLNNLNAVPELVWLKNAKPEDVKKASLAWQLWDTIPSFYEEGGQKGARPFLEGAAAIFTDPLTYAGFGVGSVAKYQIARGLIKSQIDKAAKRTAIVGGGVGAAIGVASNAIQQDIEIQTGRRDELSTAELAISGALEAVFLGSEAKSVVKGVTGKKKIKSTKEQLDEILKGKQVAETDEQREKFLKAWDAELEQTLTEFDKFEGRQTLDKLSPPTDITESQVKKNIFIQATKVAQFILLNDANFKDAAQRVANKEQKISDAIKDVYMTIENKIKMGGSSDEYLISDTTFEAALQSAGINLKEFAEAARSSIGDAGGLMKAYSDAAKIIRRAMDLDPTSKKLVERMYGKEGAPEGAFSWFANGVRRLERESKATVTAAIGTQVRNVLGTSIGLSFDAATRFVESSMFVTGKTLKGGWDLVVNKKPYERGSLQKGLSDIVKDTFGTLVYMQNAGLTAEITDKILSANPKIQSQLFKALQETGDAELTKFTRFVSSIGVAQDAFFRRAIFAASVERYARRAGLDPYEILAQNKRIPAEIIAKAAEDSLIGTFSFMPKQGFAHAFVKFFEFPGMSLVNPFPRFMVNAVGFIFKYNPIIGGSRAASDLAAAYYKGVLKKDKKETDLIAAERLAGRAMERIAQSAVGFGAILAAYQYRTENPDLKPNEMRNPDGSIVDVTPVFPIAPVLYQGELYRLFKEDKINEIKILDTLKALAGIKIPSGTQLGMIETLPELAQSVLEDYENKEVEKSRQYFGRISGDFLTRFIQPFQPIFQFLELFEQEAQIARDPNVIEGESIYSEALLNRIKNKLPIETFPETADAMGIAPLPEAVQPFREGPPVRPGEFFTSLYGIRPTPARNRLEQEAVNLGLEAYTFYPPSGFRPVDREIMQQALPYIEELTLERMDREDYQSLSKSEKKKAFTLATREAIAIAREEVLGQFQGRDQATYHKFAFNNRPALDRRILNEAYARENDGRSIDEDEAYNRQYEYEGALQLR